MKKKHSVAVLLAVMLALSAIGQSAPATFKVAAVSLTAFQKIVINTPVDIVLVQDNILKEALIEGDEKLVAALTLFIAKDVMTVSGKDPLRQEKIKMTIPVANLSWLQINDDAQVTSQNILSSPKLTVFINGNCAVNLRSSGKIVVTGVNGHEIIYTKR